MVLDCVFSATVLCYNLTYLLLKDWRRTLKFPHYETQLTNGLFPLDFLVLSKIKVQPLARLFYSYMVMPLKCVHLCMFCSVNTFIMNTFISP